jgi:hypothetical protein
MAVLFRMGLCVARWLVARDVRVLVRHDHVPWLSFTPVDSKKL